MENSLIEHYTELSDKFADDSRFSFFFRPVGNWGGERIKQMCDNIYDSVSFKKIYEKILTVQSKLSLNFGRFVSFYDNSTCSACYENSYIIGYDGMIYKCSCHFDEPGNKVGFLDCNGTMTLDISKNIRWVKAPALKETCKKCFFAPACLNMSCPIFQQD